jgi:hypothetical protein
MLEHMGGYDGWGYINAVANKKYNWYFGPPVPYTTPLSNLAGIYFTFRAIVPTVASYLSVLTVPPAVGATRWYNSKRDLMITSPIIAGQSYIGYYLFDATIPAPTRYGHLPLPLTMSGNFPIGSSVGSFLSTEMILAFVLQSNSAQTINTEQLIVSSVGVIINDHIGNIYNQPFTFTST